MNDELFARLVRGEISEATYLRGGTSDWEIGARVRVIEQHDSNGTPGLEGTIKIVRLSGRTFGIEFDEYMGGHALNESVVCKHGHGYWMPKSKLELI